MADTKTSALVENTSLAEADEFPHVDKSDTTMSAQGSTKRVLLPTIRKGILGSGSFIQCGRLTLTSGTPILTSSVTAASTLYDTLFMGDVRTDWDGTNWVPSTFTEIGITLSGLTSGRPYDVFRYIDGSGVRKTGIVAWTNGTTRATAVTLKDGVWVNNASFTTARHNSAGGTTSSGDTVAQYRGVLIGTFYTTGTTTTESSDSKRFLWNLYNQVPISSSIVSTGTHDYNTATVRSWNNSTSNRVEWVSGLPGYVHRATVGGAMLGTATGSGVYTGLGIDSTTINSIQWGFALLGGVIESQNSGDLSPSLTGYHYGQLTELGSGVATCQWYYAAGSVEMMG